MSIKYCIVLYCTVFMGVFAQAKGTIIRVLLRVQGSVRWGSSYSDVPTLECTLFLILTSSTRGHHPVIFFKSIYQYYCTTLLWTYNTTLKNTLHYYNLLTLLYRKICPIHVAIPITIEIMNLILLEIRYLHCTKLRTKHYLQWNY